MGQPLSSRAPWKWIRMLWARPRLVDVRSAGTRKSVVFALDANGLATWKMFFSLKLLSILSRKLSLIRRQWTRSIRVGGCLQTLGGGNQTLGPHLGRHRAPRCRGSCLAQEVPAPKRTDLGLQPRSQIQRCAGWFDVTGCARSARRNTRKPPARIRFRLKVFGIGVARMGPEPFLRWSTRGSQNTFGLG